MLNNSLFSDYLKSIGMKTHKSSTRDVICLDYDYGSKSFEEEEKRIKTRLNELDDPELKEYFSDQYKKINENKDKYEKLKADEIREKFYNDGVDLNYTEKDGTITTIHYEMLFRTSAKAKVGQVVFINSELYEKAYDWLTMGLGGKLHYDQAKIVELSAYAPLTTSTIVGKTKIRVENVLILKDQDSFFKTFTKIVKAENYIDDKGRKKKKCVVENAESEVKNTIWDGMALIESKDLPKWCNGMALLRNHMFKACAFRCNLRQFFIDWCEQTGNDFETYQIQDMFGKWHYVKDIRIITTDNAIKWKKFADLMGNNLTEAYEYWCERIHADKDNWGIVKTDHPSKLGQYQQLSYQMINTLPCTDSDVKDIAKDTIEYVTLLKKDNDEFEKYLRKNANIVNHYEMLADLYRHNHKFGNTSFFRKEKSMIISQFVKKLRTGKIWVNGDNLTVCGNPYALLLYSVGEDWRNDPTLRPEEGTIQCYTTRFDDGEFLAAFRNPHNSPNNICYLHNVRHELIAKYFPFSPNIIAVNCIHTDIQARANGMDEDSDFLLVTNQPNMVECAKRCYEEFPTIVNELKESGITYQNTKSSYAAMDTKFAKSRMGIGYSSNLAQLAMTYYWSELNEEEPDELKLSELYDNFVILSVLAQILIDSCKREYEIDGNQEIARISKMACMNPTITVRKSNGEIVQEKKDFPEFMRRTRPIKVTKNKKDVSVDLIQKQKDKLKNRINPDLICPMNWLQVLLDKIPYASTSLTNDIEEFYIKNLKTPDYTKMTKVMELIESYSKDITTLLINDYSWEMDSFEYNNEIVKISENLYDEISKIRLNEPTINRLIGMSFSLKMKKSKYFNDEIKCVRKLLNCLYHNNPKFFLRQFTPE